jgi:site-specific recombinase XerC
MAEDDLLRMVCLEPLIYAFPAPRTIAATLAQYERHLKDERGLSPRRLRETVRALAELLDPIEAPLVTITPALLHTLLLHQAAQVAHLPFESVSVRCLTKSRVQRFFRWATAQGYLRHSPCVPPLPLPTIAPPHWPA